MTNPYKPFLRYVSSFLTVGAAVIFLHDKVLEVMPVMGNSMHPTLSPDFHETGARDHVLFYKRNAPLHLHRGMIVSFWKPHNPEEEAVKRIVGLPGDVVYTRAGSGYPEKKVVVPWGHVWVEGDNWRGSRDSNHFGPLSASMITGKAMFTVWPWSRAGAIRLDTFKSRTRVIPAQGRIFEPEEWRD